MAPDLARNFLKSLPQCRSIKPLPVLLSILVTGVILDRLIEHRTYFFWITTHP
jgi:hypothetical protein